MYKWNGFVRQVGISLVAAAILSSCSTATTTTTPAPLAASPTTLNPGVSSAEVSTNTPAATATETTAPAATDTSTPVPTETEAATPTVAATATTASPLTTQVTPTLNAYCRKGPGSGFDAITFLLKGTAYDVTGRNSLNSWWRIQAPGNINCWVGNANVTMQGAVDQVSIAYAPPLPGTPSQFVNSFVCNVTLKTLSVAFNWAAVDNVTGYRIYRNGTELIDLGPTVTSYSDNAPLKVNLVYELEAFNDYGVAARVTATVQACG